MMGVVFTFLCTAALVGTLAAAGLLREKSRFAAVLLAGFALRLVLQFFIRDVQFFTHAAGGDSLIYEYYGQIIAKQWAFTGVRYFTADDMFVIGATSLPHNLFAAVMYINGGETTRLGCTALVALAAALTALNVYTLGVQFGAERKNAALIAGILYLQPALLFYTCDMYKDGLVLCLTIGALGSAVRLSFRYSVIHTVIGLLCVWGLWYVRFYLVFVSVAPLIVGLVGIGSKSITRPVIALLVLGTVGLFLVSYTDMLQLATERATATLDNATSERVLNSNGLGGSGVHFEDGGSATGALPQKLAYTLFSPFPWAAGSMGFQLGKLDVVLWYFVVYRAYRAAWTVDRRLILMLAAFIVPSTFMYAMSMSNVGLIVRQRLVIVAATAILAAVYSPKKSVAVKAKKAPRAARVPQVVSKPSAV
jgi:hypothetical protein